MMVTGMLLLFPERSLGRQHACSIGRQNDSSAYLGCEAGLLKDLSSISVNAEQKANLEVTDFDSMPVLSQGYRSGKAANASSDNDHIQWHLQSLGCILDVGLGAALPRGGFGEDTGYQLGIRRPRDDAHVG